MSSQGTSRQRPRSGSLFLRTAAYSALVTILTLCAFGLRFFLYEKESLYRHLQDRAETLALALESASGPGGIDAEKVMAQSARLLAKDQQLLYVVYTPYEGDSSIRTARGQHEESLQTRWRTGDDMEGIRTSDWSGNQPLEVFHHTRTLVTAEGEKAWLHVGISPAPYREGVRSLYQILFDLVGPGLLIGFLTSFLFANRLTRPIGDLKRFAKRIASGDLESRVDIPSNTELGLLGDTMNQMVEDLQQSQSNEKEAMEKEGRLREQEILLKEIHHRVKNNLQILSSLLRMQARKAQSEDMKGMLKESEARIRSMGLIHEKLYQSNSLSTVDLKSYVDTLSGQLLRMHAATDQKLNVAVDIDDVELPLDTAMPCGLIINELVSNSLKYAFTDGRDGRIDIAVTPQGERSYRMTVKDDGVGMKKLPVAGERRSSLGMNLIEMLVDQLNGTLEYRNGDGTTAEIEFRETVYTNRM